jgi:hypothetical protein
MEGGDRKRNDGLFLEGREVFAHPPRFGIGWGGGYVFYNGGTLLGVNGLWARTDY